MMTAPWGRYYTIACWHRCLLPYWHRIFRFQTGIPIGFFFPLCYTLIEGTDGIPDEKYSAFPRGKSRIDYKNQGNEGIVT